MLAKQKICFTTQDHKAKEVWVFLGFLNLALKQSRLSTDVLCSVLTCYIICGFSTYKSQMSDLVVVQESRIYCLRSMEKSRKDK